MKSSQVQRCNATDIIVTIIFCITSLFSIGCSNQQDQPTIVNQDNVQNQAENLSPPPPRFESDSAGVVTDNVTGLEWMVGPDSDVRWYDACNWVSELGDDWRMPIRAELVELYNAGITANHWRLFSNTGLTVWTGQETSSRLTAYDVGFTDGDIDATNKSTYYCHRVFAVRSTGPARFVQDTDGIITDNVTSLQWLVGPTQPISWSDASEWVDNLGSNWRLPTGDELLELYNAGIISTNMGQRKLLSCCPAKTKWQKRSPLYNSNSSAQCYWCFAYGAYA